MSCRRCEFTGELTAHTKKDAEMQQLDEAFGVDFRKDFLNP